jgi:integrase
VNGVQHLLASGPDGAPSGPTYLEALDLFRRLMEVGSLDRAGDSNSVRVVLNAYLNAIDNVLKPGTFRLRLEACKLFSDRWGGLRCADIKPFHCEQIITEMRRERKVGKQVCKWGDGQAGIFIMSLNAGFNWAVKQQLIARNPLATVSVPKNSTKSRERTLTPEEHQAVPGALETKRTNNLRNIVVALENTGARPGELCNAKAQDWHDDVGAIVYYRDSARRESDFSHKSGRKKDRVIYITGEALEMVRELVKKRLPGQYIFPTRTGRRYEDRHLVGCFKELRKRTNLPHLVPYVYRHTFATRWLTKGESVEVLATLMGNTPAVIMNHYAHLLHEHDALRAQLERVRGTT